AAPITIILDALSFLISALFLWRINTREPEPEPRTQESHLRREIMEGLRVVFGNPSLRAIAACTATSNLLGSVQGAIYILFIRWQLGLDAGKIGLIAAVGSIGGLLGALFSDRIARILGVGPTIIVSATFFGFASLLVPLAMDSGLLSVGLLIGSGALGG